MVDNVVLLGAPKAREEAPKHEVAKAAKAAVTGGVADMDDDIPF